MSNIGQVEKSVEDQLAREGVDISDPLEYLEDDGEVIDDINLPEIFEGDEVVDSSNDVYGEFATEDGIPVFAETHSGNTSDGSLFQETILLHRSLSQKVQFGWLIF